MTSLKGVDYKSVYEEFIMWRFKPSKYKNAVPKIPKKGEGWITDISVGSVSSFGNHIKASSLLMAFNIDSGGGGNLGILSLNDTGSKSKDLSILRAHSEFITDFDFCPYDDEILATGSQDHHIKLWRITENDLNSNVPNNPEVDILASSKIEVIKFHPQADCIVSAVEGSTIHLWDVNKKQSIFADSSHEDTVQCISWRHSGDILASTSKDKKLRLWDPRDPSNNQVADSHSNNRDSRVVWLGDTEQLLTTGFGSGREREVLLRDIRKLQDPVASYSGDSSLGVYIPLFDPDTNMLFLIAKADTAISFWEILNHAPFLQEATKYLGEVQAKGAALVPKRALEVMDGEVNRLLLLGQNCIVPISFQVPRKSYREFHADLFPDTFSPAPSLTSTQWQAGEKAKVSKVSLMPSKAGKTLIKTNHHLGSGPKKEVFSSSVDDTVSSESDEKVSGSKELETEKLDANKSSKPQPARKPSPPIKPKPANIETKITKSSPVLTPKHVDNVKQAFNNKENPEPPKKTSPAVKRSTRTFGMRVSKFRHLNGNIFPKEFHITDLPTLTRTVPGECNGFDANEKRIAVPVGAPGNFLAILELKNSGRSAAAADMPGVLTSATVMDFMWDPFNSSRLAVVCDTGDVQIWTIPEGGLQEKLEEPLLSFKAHSEKASIVKFHPCASDIIATASSDLTVRIWDLSTQEEKFCLQGHMDQILNLAWSPDGQFIATVSKDQKVRIFDPRNSSDAIKEGPGPQGTRGARIVWVLNSTCLAVTGFSKVSERQINLYDCKDLNIMGQIGLDVSPATLVPHYDEDSSTLFLSGKGDSVIFAYEVATDNPYFHPLSHYKCNNPHQSISFLPKSVCNVQEVEFSRAIRLTASTIEPISFLVPRLRSEYFQDDLFPPTRKTWQPSMTNSEWFAGINNPVEILDMKPSEMIPLSEAPLPVKAGNNKNSSNTSPKIMFEGEVVLQSSLAFLQNSKEKEEKIKQSMSSQCELQESSLPQEEFEGVDPNEWAKEEKLHSQQNL
ncbi:coronin-7 [Caerostris darwini]|uniref:Coronin n=1 Tax=Caerostris darwini TaxID=1538125 RepID=A0AAV4QHC8_9ARAC|nr:coronin-7 [Caerostris darwini]